jgi:hypothetical protein
MVEGQGFEGDEIVEGELHLRPIPTPQPPGTKQPHIESAERSFLEDGMLTVK